MNAPLSPAALKHLKERVDAHVGATYLRMDLLKALEELERARELLAQADELYSQYGLVCGPVKGYPEYTGVVDVGRWIGDVRKLTRPQPGTTEGAPA